MWWSVRLPLAEMVEKVTEEKVFFWRDAKGMERTVAALKEGYESGRPWASGDDVCKLVPKGGRLGDDAEIGYSMYAPEDVEDYGPRPVVSCTPWVCSLR